MNDFRKENDLDGSQGDLRALGHPQRPRQAQLWGVEQVPFIFIKMNFWNMVHERFLKRKWSRWVPRASEGSLTPSTSSTKASKASTSLVHQKLTWHMFICYFAKKNRFKTVPVWSRGSRTPSAASSSSTMGSSANTTWVHQKLIWLMFIYHFSKINGFKIVPSWSWCSWTPSATSTSSTKASTASTSYVYQNLTWHMFISFFQRQINLKQFEHDTRWSWTWRGWWGCPRASWSPCNKMRQF